MTNFKKGDLIRWEEDNDLAIVVSVCSSTGNLRIKWLTIADPYWDVSVVEVMPDYFVRLIDKPLT